MIEILQNADCCVSSPLKEKLQVIESLHGKYSVHVLCDVLKVPRGTYYNHIFRNKRENNAYTKHRDELRPLIQNIFHESNQTFGSPKIAAVLREQSYPASPATVLRIMRELGLYSVSPTSKQEYLKWKRGENKNIIKQNFRAELPNKIWVSDVTYFNYNGTAYYLCVIIDLYSRRIIAHRVSKKHSTVLITKTFRAAYTDRKPESGLIFHSDRGAHIFPIHLGNYYRNSK